MVSTGSAQCAVTTHFLKPQPLISFIILFQRMMAPAVMTTGAVVLYAAPTPVYAKEASPVDVAKVRDSIKDVMDTDMDKRGDGTSLYGTMIRLAWHCAGTYAKDDESGGSNGARMRFDPEASWGANAGLKVARDALEPVKAKYPNISYADCKCVKCVYLVMLFVVVEKVADIIPATLVKSVHSCGCGGC